MIHIHNGDLVLAAARRIDIPGEHVAFRESLVTGRVVPGDDWIETRAHALAAFDTDLLRLRTDLLEQEQMLDAAPSRGEIVLWFEHDLFCLVHLVYLLQRFAEARMSLVWCATPLTDQDDRALHLLFESRAAAAPAVIELAAEVWRAYTASDPTELNQFLDHDRPELAFLSDGVRLHASRFPSVRNGLGTIEQRALELIAAGTSDFASIFGNINAEVPRLGFGDGEILRHLRALASRPVPLITMAGDPPKAIFALTPAGENVMRGDVDDLEINDPDLWLGGAHLTRDRTFRWNGERIES